jgi:RNA polymerase sigma-70 factor (ECF subfamily)
LGRNSAIDAFYEVIWPHRVDVLRFARFLTRDASVAEDVAQDSLLKAFKAVAELETGSNARAWLLKIVRNTWLDRLRSQASRHETSLEDLPIEPVAAEEPWTQRAGPPEDSGDLLEPFSDSQVIDALLELPEEMRWTLLLIDVEGLGIAEAAGILGVPEGTVKSRCHRGRGLLRTVLLPLARQHGLAPEVREDQ